MWRFVTLFAVVSVLAWAAPQDLVGSGDAGVGDDSAGAAPARLGVPLITSTTAAPSKEQEIKEISRSEIVNADGSFNFSYELSNGVHVEESGYVKRDPQAAGRALDAATGDQEEDTGEINVAQGSYTYTAPDGTVINLSYTADENGFQPHGEHLPTPHPAIQRALDAIAAGELDSGDTGAGVGSSVGLRTGAGVGASAGAGAGGAQASDSFTGRSAAGVPALVSDAPASSAAPAGPVSADAASPAPSAAPTSLSAASAATEASAEPALPAEAPGAGAEPAPPSEDSTPAEAPAADASTAASGADPASGSEDALQ